MTGHAGTGQCIAVIEACAEERGCVGMAGFARVVGHDVTCRHRRSHYPRPLAVASGTVAGSALEHPAGMARAALGLLVGACQWKACFKMREFLRRGLRRRIQQVRKHASRHGCG